MDYIVKHAMDNVWCNFKQDNQLIFKLARLTPFGGALNKFRIHWDIIDLPEVGSFFHIYHIGQIFPENVNLLDTTNQWMSFTSACNDKEILLDIYTPNGIIIPKFLCYYFVTRNKDLIFAVKKNKKINYSFNDNDIYLRSYFSSYFQSPDSNSLSDKVYVKGGTISTSDKILEYQNEIIAKRQLQGEVNCFLNGNYVTDINVINTVVGDVVEYLYDGSVKKKITLDLKDLKSFDSTLDNKSKLVIHPDKDDDNVIDYQDDVDIFIYNNINKKGIYMHKNNKDTLRNITHKDYSIVAGYITYYLDYLKINGVVNINDIKIRLNVHYNGFDRGLLNEVNRINELYKLPNTKIIDAMVGDNSLVSVWQANSLERAKYIELMNAEFKDIDIELITETYGYDTIVNITANPYQVPVVVNNVLEVIIPYALRPSCTIFEYNSNGYLLGYYTSTNSGVYICVNSSCVLVEMIYGKGTDLINENYDNIVPYNSNNNYRYYSSDIVNNIPQYNWSDVTGSNQYSTVNNTSVWNTTNKKHMVRDDTTFLCYSLNLNLEEGRLEFPLIYKTTRNGSIDDLPLQVPLGELDIFLNGKSLISGLDYYYDNPRIIITNKQYLNYNSSQSVVIRFTGFCNNQLLPFNVGETGYVQRGNLSDNHKYLIKDNKAQRIIVDGKLKLLSQVDIYEDSSTGTSYTLTNGKPYLIRDLVVPTNVVNRDAYEFINESIVIDNEIIDYLTVNTNQVSPPNMNVINDKYYLFSPFLSTILNELKDGNIELDPLARYNDDFIRSICVNYEYLLKYDPIQIENQHSKDFVTVHIHPYVVTVDLKLHEYRFFTRVIELYANGNINIADQLSIS